MKKLLHFRIYRKLNVMYLIIVSATILILSCTLFAFFRKTFIADINNNNVTVLSQKNEVFSNLIEQSNSVAVQILNNNVVKDYFRSGQNLPLEKYYVAGILEQIYPIYPFISSVELCSAKNGSYYNTSPLPQTVKDYIMQESFNFIAAADTNKISCCIRSYMNQSHSYSLTETTIFSIFIPSYKNTDLYVIINIPQDYLLDILGLENTSESQIFLINKDHSMLMPGGAQNAEILQQDLALSQVIEGQKQGFLQIIGNHQYITNYIKTDFFDFYLVKLVPSGLALKNSTSLLMITILIAAIAIIVAFLFVITASRKIYAPVISIVENIDNSKYEENFLDEFKIINSELLKLKEKADNSTSINNKNQKIIDIHILTSLLMGKNNSQTHELLSFSQKLQYLAANQYFYIAQFIIEPAENYSIQDKDIVDYALTNIIEEVLGSLFDIETVVISPHKICAIVSGINKKNAANLKDLLSEAEFQIQKYIFSSITVVCSSEITSPDMIAKAYEECQALLSERFFCQKGTIITSEYAKLRMGETSSLTLTDDYSSNIINLLYDYTTHDQLLENLAAFMEELSKQTYEIAKLELLTYVTDLKKSLYRHRKLLSFTPLEIEEQCNIIINAPTLADVSEQLYKMADIIQGQLKSNSDSKITQKHYDLVRMIKMFAKDNYQDQNFSLNIVASHSHVSAGYLGKIFRDVTGISFTKYLCSLRLEHAKELLVTTNLPSYKIAEEIGILSATYFTTLFKKEYGKTPAQYREMYGQLSYNNSSETEQD